VVPIRMHTVQHRLMGIYLPVRSCGFEHDDDIQRIAHGTDICKRWHSHGRQTWRSYLIVRSTTVSGCSNANSSSTMTKDPGSLRLYEAGDVKLKNKIPSFIRSNLRMVEASPLSFTCHYILHDLMTASLMRKLSLSPSSSYLLHRRNTRPPIVLCDKQRLPWPEVRLYRAQNRVRQILFIRTHRRVPPRTITQLQQSYVHGFSRKRGQCVFLKDEEQRLLRNMQADTPHVSELSGDLDLCMPTIDGLGMNVEATHTQSIAEQPGM